MRLPRPLFLLQRALLHGLTLAVIGLVRILPERAAYGLGRAIALTAWRLIPSWRAVADTNLRIFYRGEPIGADDSAGRRGRERIGRAAAINLGWYAIEFIRMGTLPVKRAMEMVVGERGSAAARDALSKCQGIIALGMHYGNWELAGAWVTREIGPLHAVGKEQRDDFFTRIAFPWREKYGITNILAGDKVNSAVLRALKQGAVLGLIADQNGGRNGTFAPFAGTLASTVAGPAALALRTGAPVMLLYMHRLAPGQLEFICEQVDIGRGAVGPSIAEGPGQAKATPEEIVEALTRINTAYEQVIRADPTQWLWGHPRWKTRPPGEASLYK